MRSSNIGKIVVTAEVLRNLLELDDKTIIRDIRLQHENPEQVEIIVNHPKIEEKLEGEEIRRIDIDKIKKEPIPIEDRAKEVYRPRESSSIVLITKDEEGNESKFSRLISFKDIIGSKKMKRGYGYYILNREYVLRNTLGNWGRSISDRVFVDSVVESVKKKTRLLEK